MINELETISSTDDIWLFFFEEHNLILTESQILDIVQVVEQWQAKQAAQQK